jgi:hypothetical protein
MAPVADPGSEGPPRRSHALQTPRDPTFLRRAFAVRLDRSGGGTALVVENRAGHRVPGLDAGQAAEPAEQHVAVLEHLDRRLVVVSRDVLDRHSERVVQVPGQRSELLRQLRRVLVRDRGEAQDRRRPAGGRGRRLVAAAGDGRGEGECDRGEESLSPRRQDRM